MKLCRIFSGPTIVTPMTPVGPPVPTWPRRLRLGCRATGHGLAPFLKAAQMPVSTLPPTPLLVAEEVLQ